MHVSLCILLLYKVYLSLRIFTTIQVKIEGGNAEVTKCAKCGGRLAFCCQPDENHNTVCCGFAL